MGSVLPLWFIVSLLEPRSILIQCKHYDDVDIQNDVLLIYQACLNVKNLPKLESAYKLVTVLYTNI